MKSSRLDSGWFTLALWLALAWIWAGATAWADVWTSAKPPPLANSPKKLESSKPVVKQSLTTAKRPAGYHEHSCPRCGTRWGHGHDSFGSVAQHTCPNCKTIVWHKAATMRLNCPTNH